MLEIRTLANRREFEDFFCFPWRHYADDANWAPPLLSMRRQLLDKTRHPAWKYMDGEYFAAWRFGRMVGTIAAFINHEHNRYHDENIGFFGLFESVDDQAVAAGLLEAAADWIRARGADAIRGPASFTTNEECGLLVENFAPPVIMMPYNPPYYARLVEGAGFEKVMDVHCIYQDRATIETGNTLQRLERLVKRASQRSGIRVRPMNARDKKTEFERFREIYNAAWEKNWGFIPMNDEELRALVKDLGMLVEADLAFFAEIADEPVGFALTIPNFNEAAAARLPRPASRSSSPWLKSPGTGNQTLDPRRSHAPDGRQSRPAKQRRRAGDAAGGDESAAASRYDYLDSGWILETNPLIKISLSLGGKIYKTHRFYQKSLAA